MSSRAVAAPAEAHLAASPQHLDRSTQRRRRDPRHLWRVSRRQGVSFLISEDASVLNIDPPRPIHSLLISVLQGLVRHEGGCYYYDVKLAPTTSVFQEIPEGWTAFLYTLSGAVVVDGGQSYGPSHTVVLSSKPGQNGVQLSSASTSEETRFVLIAGEPLNQARPQSPFHLVSPRILLTALRSLALVRRSRRPLCPHDA